MADMFSKRKRSEVMAAIHSSGNKETELTLVQILRMNHITGWRRHMAVFGNPDFVFPKARLVIFVDGCFWHACPKHFRMPKSNKSYWEAKIARNKKRDRLVMKSLKEKGWRVLRIWQHQLRHEKAVVRRLRTALE